MAKNAQPQNTDNSKKLKYILRGLTVILILPLILTVAAKYIYRREATTVAVAGEIYFTSDYLTESDKEYVLAPDTKSLTFTLRNYEDELRFTNYPIDYTVSVNGIDSFTDQIPAGQRNTAKITLNDLEPGGTYVVHATTVTGFKKTIKATFRVLEEDKAIYKYVKNTDEYVLLTVWTQGVSGTVKVSTNADNLVPDNTSAVMENVKTSGGAISFEDDTSFNEEYSSYTYRFFKNTQKNVTADEFTVTLGSAQATVRNPEK